MYKCEPFGENSSTHWYIYYNEPQIVSLNLNDLSSKMFFARNFKNLVFILQHQESLASTEKKKKKVHNPTNPTHLLTNFLYFLIVFFHTFGMLVNHNVYAIFLL